MPSTLVGAQSGGVPLVSGNPYSGNFNLPSTVRLKLSNVTSGCVYLGYSGGVTILSGGGLGSGGLLDGIELAAGQSYSMNVQNAPPSFGVGGLFVTCAAGVSGTLHLMWDTN